MYAIAFDLKIDDLKPFSKLKKIISKYYKALLASNPYSSICIVACVIF